MVRFRLIALVLLLSMWIPAAVAAPPTAPATKLAKAPTIDGALSPGEWDGSAHLEPFIDPVTSKPAEEATEVWIGYDPEAIYVAFHCHDSHPEGIVARERQPEADFGGEDFVEFMIDPFNPHQGVSNAFVVNALGTQSEYIAGGRSAKREWRGEWQAATQRVSDGWTCEMRIPWRLMNLPSGRTRDMGLNFHRSHPRTKVDSFWANQGVDGRPEYVGTWAGVELPSFKRRQLFYQAYATPEFVLSKEGDRDFRAGLDVRYDFNPQQSGLLSLNPDFRNIEQQVEEVGFSRTERFYGDARPFFREGSDYFYMGGAYGSLFYSRRIDDFDLGAKFFGKVTPNDSVGALVTREGSWRTDFVAKYNKQSGARRGFSFYTAHRAADGNQNAAYGVDGGYGVGPWGIGAAAATVDDDGTTGDAGTIRLDYNIPRVYANVQYQWASPEFHPALGYASFTDRRGVDGYAQYYRDYRHGPLRSHIIALYACNYKTYGGSNQQRTVFHRQEIVTRKGTLLALTATNEQFGEEPEKTIGVSLGLNIDDRYRQLWMHYEGGTRAHKSHRSYSVSGGYRLFGHVDLGLSHFAQDYLGHVEQTVGTLGWEIDARRSLSARWVRTNGENNFYLAYRSAGFKGMEWYVIVGDPNSRRWHDRVAVKAVWAW